ncbi:uncharacterized protein EAE98_000695 [Botrytis deweyae]|uniref:Secreted protein n=1 Tax=Botrytis deweyae TaxID=2478750 RepID=A0ABQ7J3N2_9HELO|nr:uncharacterized protein EAE98_000695 [Botrytis deweyae]KAF7940568.1 hypothetical protein EAE98_000695 [Botrytis deweyae]
MPHRLTVSRLPSILAALQTVLGMRAGTLGCAALNWALHKCHCATLEAQWHTNRVPRLPQLQLRLVIW